MAGPWGLWSVAQGPAGAKSLRHKVTAGAKGLMLGPVKVFINDVDRVHA